jgi:fucose 4-O-acetylase-like acetyltransferase
LLRVAGLYWIDNARYWLETFVIAKHTMVYVGTLYTWNTWWQPGLAAFFESFMMPMFCACSGYLSKGTPSPDRCLRVLFRAWVPFVIVNVFYEWIDNGFGPSGLRGTYTNLLNSLEVSWFLCCWIQWRLLLPYICALPPSVAITVSYMLSWFSGYWFDSEPTFHQDEVRAGVLRGP